VSPASGGGGPSGGAAAGTRIPARTGAELVNVWQGQLHWDLGDVLRGLVGSGWLPGGGRRDTSSGEPAARAGQQASAGATGAPSGVRSSTCLRTKASGGGVHREGTYGRRRRLGARVGRRPAVFIAQLEAVEAMSWAPT
jgi:hypothetical protein